MLVKGDQIPITIVLKSNGRPISPSELVDLRIKMNKKIFDYPEKIEYNSTTGKWIVYLTQNDLIDLGDIVEMCVQVNFGGTPALIRTTPVHRFFIKNSNFNEIWR